MDTDYAECKKGMFGDYVPDNGPCARINAFVVRKVFLILPYTVTPTLAVRYTVTHGHAIYGNLIHTLMHGIQCLQLCLRRSLEAIPIVSPEQFGGFY